MLLKLISTILTFELLLLFAPIIGRANVTSLTTPDKFKNMVLIPAGTFRTGSDTTFAKIAPAQDIYLDSFYIDKHEVTQDQFSDVMNSNPSKFRGLNLPVNAVSWEEADQYCQKINKRLPREMEWEKATRAGSSTRFYWGNKFEGHFAWVSENSDGSPHPVGLKSPNSFGLHDMIGNVWEWVADWYDDNYYQKMPDSNPGGPSKGEYKVVRGGSWDTILPLLGAAYRTRAHPTVQFAFFGFRCAADPEQ